ncbi:hypothetical protein [Streptomyces triculaminicus]|uniref:hypothetical protein n=1 Tax=Streptomyces triculaminicus TaxID=2816232 RepID=UPI003787A01D
MSESTTGPDKVVNQPTPPHDEAATVGPRCGNNPATHLTDGDRQAVAEFKTYLAQRAALHHAREQQRLQDDFERPAFGEDA